MIHKRSNTKVEEKIAEHNQYSSLVLAENLQDCNRPSLRKYIIGYNILIW